MGGRGREEDIFLTFKVSHVGVTVPPTREKLIEENITKAGRKEGGRGGR